MNNDGMPRIIVVDDDPLVLESLNQIFLDDYHVDKAESGDDAITLVKNGNRYDAAIVDIRMAGVDGLQTAGVIAKIDPDLPILFYTGYPGDFTEEQIDKEYRPYDIIIKNERPARLLRAVKNAVAMRRLKRNPAGLINGAREYFGIVGTSKSMVEVYQQIEKTAASDSKVIILGETGTGKELVAQAIHKRSLRSDKRLAIFSCNRRQPHLVEAELFGHVKGAFTGATEDRIGLFEFANGGTVFLDEIGDLDFNTQTKLLRVTEYGQMQRVGSPETIEIDIRIICATHRNLKSMVDDGQFREDLYYRLNGMTIRLPRLCERQDDIPLLLDYFSQRYCEKCGIPIKVFAQEARDFMISYEWPGNVRQLKDTLKVIIDQSPSSFISREDVARYIEFTGDFDLESKSYEGQLNRARKTIIVQALVRNSYNVAQAAAEIGLNRHSLYKLIRKFGIELAEKTNDN